MGCQSFFWVFIGWNCYSLQSYILLGLYVQSIGGFFWGSFFGYSDLRIVLHILLLLCYLDPSKYTRGSGLSGASRFN